MPLDRHAHHFLEMLVATGHSRGRYDDVEERRAALTSLADLVDPHGMEVIGGVRDHLMPGPSNRIVHERRLRALLGEGWLHYSILTDVEMVREFLGPKQHLFCRIRFFNSQPPNESGFIKR